MRRRVSTAMDSDALQADVMRFMAIIAFCLIAVLALVRQIEPTAAEAPQVEVVREAVQQVMPNAAREPIEPATAPSEAPESEVLPSPQGSSAGAQPAAAVPAASPAAQIAGLGSSPDDPELILRFATDQDFLRLVAKGDVRVFLFSAERSFRLRSDYRFTPATTPRQLFEVMPATIPALIRRQAATLPEVAALQYGLQFPERIERQLDAYLAEVDSGALLIDRYGHVSHVSSEH